MTGYPKFLILFTLIGLLIIGGINLLIFVSGTAALLFGDLAIACGLGLILALASTRRN